MSTVKRLILLRLAETIIQRAIQSPTVAVGRLLLLKRERQIASQSVFLHMVLLILEKEKITPNLQTAFHQDALSVSNPEAFHRWW